jgi:hypothetical protein
MSLRIRLFILAVAATLPSLVLLVSNQIALLNARYHEIETQVLGLAEQQSAELTQYGEGALQFLAALSQIPIIRDATDPKLCDDELEGDQTQLSAITWTQARSPCTSAWRENLGLRLQT